MSKTALKALVTLVTGLNTWCATFLPAIWAGLIGIATATLLVFLVPNAAMAGPADRPEPWTPPERDA